MARHRAEDMNHNQLEDTRMNTNQPAAKVNPAAPKPVDTAASQIVDTAASQTAKPAETAEKTEHTMKRGDTLRNVAARYGTSPEYLIKINEIEDPNAIKVDQTIKLKA